MDYSLFVKIEKVKGNYRSIYVENEIDFFEQSNEANTLNISDNDAIVKLYSDSSNRPLAEIANIRDIRGSFDGGPTFRNRLISKDHKEVYHIGIIDFLQTYDW